MTYEQTLQAAEGGLVIYQEKYPELTEQIEYQKTIIDALKKQVKMQHHHTAIKEVDGKGVYFRFSICPNCLGEIISYKNGKYPRYCNWCSQAIDWSDVE